MRILMINSEYPPIGGGASNANAHLAEIMQARGHAVTVLTTRHADLPHEETRDGVNIVRTRALRRDADRSNPKEQISFMLGAIIGALREAGKAKPDVVLAFFGVPSGPAALALKLLRGIPYIVSLRGGDVPGFRPYDFSLYHKLVAPVLRPVWRKAAVVVANSRGLRQLALQFDRHVPIKIIPNGVQPERFMDGPREWQPPRLLSVGRVVYQKGFDLILDALAGIPEMEWHLTIAGDGLAQPALREQAARLGIAERVTFAGWQEKEDLFAQYARANLFVYPSRDEGMPNAVLEAMASGLPVIASRIAGNEELVLENETGLLISPEDAGAVADALRELLPDGERRRKMGAAGRARVVAEYDWEHTADQYLELMKKAVEENR